MNEQVYVIEYNLDLCMEIYAVVLSGLLVYGLTILTAKSEVVSVIPALDHVTVRTNAIIC